MPDLGRGRITSFSFLILKQKQNLQGRGTLFRLDSSFRRLVFEISKQNQVRDSVLKISAGCRTSSLDDGIVDPFWGPSVPGGVVLPYMGYIGMCRCEGYGFQAVWV